MASFNVSLPKPTHVVRRTSNVVTRASTTDRAPSTAARPTEEKSTGSQPDASTNIRPFFQSNNEHGDPFPWVVVAKNFTAKIIDSWAASPPSEDEVDAISAQILVDAAEAELELELSPSSKEQKESVYGMWADWDRY